MYAGWKWLALLAVLLFACVYATPASAQHSRLSNTSGGKLMRLCYGGDREDANICEAYITGIYDTLSDIQQNGGSAIACVPDSASAVVIRPMILLWMREHPDDTARQASTVVLHVLQASFPCNGAPSFVPQRPVVTQVPGMAIPDLAVPSLMLPDLAPMRMHGADQQQVQMPSGPTAPMNAARTPNHPNFNSPTPNNLPPEQALVPSTPPSAIIPIPDSP